MFKISIILLLLLIVLLLSIIIIILSLFNFKERKKLFINIINI